MPFRKLAIIAAVLSSPLILAAVAQSAPAVTEPHPPAVSETPAAASQVGESAHSLERADLETWLDGMVPYALQSGDIAGGVIAVVKDGHVLLEKGYGYADVAKKIPMDPAHTLMRIGSTSKLFTWTAVMQLVEQHKLDLNIDINRYLDFKVSGKDGHPITLINLMNHTAGFEEGLKDILTDDPNGMQSTEQYLKQHPRPMLFTPGTVPAYSNYGAALAGYIVQRVSGEPFDEYVQRHILAPLDMKHSTFVQPVPPVLRSAVAQGYATASEPPRPFEIVVTEPAGSASATADDLSRFMIAQLQQGRFGDRQILSQQIAAFMQSPSESALPGFGKMAHGFFYDVHNGRVVIGHGGDTIVFHTEMDLLPKENVGIYYTFNSRGKNDAVYGLRQQLLDRFMDRYFPAPKPVTPPAIASAPKDAQEIAGLYEGSRRVEHGFISFFYLLQQTPITANADGTINAPGAPGLDGTVIMREVGPQLWQDVNGPRQLALRNVDGVKTVIDSADAISVLQEVPVARSSSLNLPILLVSLAILLWTLVLWPLSPLLRRGNNAQIGVSPEIRRARLFLRGAALLDVIYLFAWAMLLQPILGSHVEVYSTRTDWIVRTLQVSGLFMVAAIGVGLWAALSTFRLGAPWLSRIWSGAVGLALLGILWIGVMGNLLSFNLNY